ncbi:hypothetical protein [Calothrix sp. NIES-2100]
MSSDIASGKNSPTITNAKSIPDVTPTPVMRSRAITTRCGTT